MSHERRDPLSDWLSALEERHLRDLTFPEVRRALQALSSLYVERRGKLAAGAALEGRGKRAAFALFYGPLHFLLVSEIVRELNAARIDYREVVDLGCGTGAAGAAWALASGGGARVNGIDRSAWAVDEARWTLSTLGLRGACRRADIEQAELPSAHAAILAAFTVNEQEAGARTKLLGRLIEAAGRGASILIVEPIARRPLPWWSEWASAFARAGGREDLWRFAVELPEPLRKLDRAAALDHRTLTGRSLFIPGQAV